MNISLEPVLRLGVTIKKDCFNKKIFQDMLNIFTFCQNLFFNRMGVMGDGQQEEQITFLKFLKKFCCPDKEVF